MASRLKEVIAVSVFSFSLLWGAGVSEATDSDAVRNHAEQSFQQFPDRNEQGRAAASGNGSQYANHSVRGFSSEHYLIGVGQGDMTKGPIVCQRVSELSARTDLAKQIRIFVKEHMVDRIRERSGRAADQDIELTREEIVQEYLEGVKIIDRQIDEDKKICTATAVMPRSKLHVSTPTSDLPASPPMIR